ncbi:TPA: hypothetical protein ACH3X3_007747 [Trebouxia sp. C0006]
MTWRERLCGSVLRCGLLCSHGRMQGLGKSAFGPQAKSHQFIMGKATPVHYGHILMLKQCQRRSSASFPWHILESNILLALSSGSLPAGTQQMVFDKGGCCS